MKKHVLLIDESDSVLQTIKQAFTQLIVPFKCTWAKSGLQGVEQIKYLLPDIVLLNVNITGLDVFTTIEAIREIKHASTVPLIVYWFGLNNQSYINESLPGATGYLKNGTPGELITTFSRYLPGIK